MISDHLHYNDVIISLNCMKQTIVFPVFRLKTLGQVCLHIEAVKKRNDKKPEVLPEYNCLVLSPANLWQQSIELFAQDTNLINTIFSYQVKTSDCTEIEEKSSLYRLF